MSNTIINVLREPGDNKIEAANDDIPTVCIKDSLKHLKLISKFIFIYYTLVFIN